MTLPASPGALGRNRRRLIVLAWMIATAVVAVSIHFLDWRRALVEMRSANAAWLVLAVVLNASILLLWALLWDTVLPAGARVSLWRLAEITALTSMVLNTLPFLIGEATGMVLLSRRAGLGHAGALSVLAVDQLLLGIAKVLLLLLVPLFVPLPPWMRQGLFALSATVGALLFLMLVMAHRGRLPRSVRSSGRLAPLRRTLDEWTHGLEGLRSWRRFFGALLLEVGKKTAELGGIVAVQYAFGNVLPLGESLLVLAALNLVTVLPVSPANIGVYEAAVYFAYRYLGLPEQDALGMALVQHICYLLPLAGIGYVVLSVRQLRR